MVIEFEIEEVTSKTLAQFADVHAGGFHTKPEYRLLNQASFAEQTSSGRLKICVLKADGKVVAGGVFQGIWPPTLERLPPERMPGALATMEH